MAEPQETLLEKFNERYIPEPTTGCWLWTGYSNPQGYGYVAIGCKTERAHRASYMLFKGPVPQGMCVCHKCDTPGCVNPDHLFLGTKGDNIADMRAKGKGKKDRLLSPEAVRFIRRNYGSNGYSQEELAALLNVSQGTISQVVRRLTWRDVP